MFPAVSTIPNRSRKPLVPLVAFMRVSGEVDGAARTLPLGLANLSITAQYRGDYGMLFAGIVLVTLPILLICLLLQRQIVKGIATGALKG